MSTSKLFEETITTIGYNQHDILEDIMDLYCPNGFECDPTYSKGNFYKGDIPQPFHKYDINPQVDGVIKADARDLPLEDESIISMIFDPPFVGASIGKGKTGIIKERFGYYKNVIELWTFYIGAIKEAYRILKPEGIYVFKCQDTVESGKNWFSHVQVFNFAEHEGFIGEDLFILLAKNRIVQKIEKQHHARKYHSYFWVFRKEK